MAKHHSPLLKGFIYLLVAMMVFSAVGVMVIYLNVPTQQLPLPEVSDTVSGDSVNTISIPSVDTNSGVVIPGSETNTGIDSIVTGSDSIVTGSDTIATGENEVNTGA